MTVAKPPAPLPDYCVCGHLLAPFHNDTACRFPGCTECEHFSPMCLACRHPKTECACQPEGQP